MRQIVITRQDGKFKVATMYLASNGMGQTLRTYYGGFFYACYRVATLLPFLRSA